MIIGFRRNGGLGEGEDRLDVEARVRSMEG
jgi:hypothetical protein